VRVPPDAFVSAKIDLQPRSKRLSVKVLHAEDGATQTLGIFDRVGGFDREPRSTMPTRCTPTSLAIARSDSPGAAFADGSCSTPVSL
jgi:hypothetical protein